VTQRSKSPASRISAAPSQSTKTPEHPATTQEPSHPTADTNNDNLGGDTEPESMEIDARGDFFGDYANYSHEDFGMDQEASDVGQGDVDEGESEDEYHSTVGNLDGCGLEPDRPPISSMDIPLDDVEETGAAARLRGGAEENLQKKPFVVKFASGEAGKVYSENGLDENTRYHQSLKGGDDNPYRPFVSKRDWEVARWAKLRGSGSTAFSDLMKINGVCRNVSVSNFSTHSNEGAGIARVILQEQRRVEQDDRHNTTWTATI